MGEEIQDYEEKEEELIDEDITIMEMSRIEDIEKAIASLKEDMAKVKFAIKRLGAALKDNNILSFIPYRLEDFD